MENQFAVLNQIISQNKASNKEMQAKTSGQAQIDTYETQMINARNIVNQSPGELKAAQKAYYTAVGGLSKYQDFKDTLQEGKPIDVPKPQLTDQEEKECNFLFRRIATITHPDKLGNNSKIEEKDKKKLEELYKESNEASEGGDYDTLVKVAGKLGFEDITENEFYLEKTVKKLSEKIKHLQTTYAWVWYNERDKEKLNNLKQHIMETYT